MTAPPEFSIAPHVEPVVNKFVHFQSSHGGFAGKWFSAKPGGHICLSKDLSENETFLLAPVPPPRSAQSQVSQRVRIITFWHDSCLVVSRMKDGNWILRHEPLATAGGEGVFECLSFPLRGRNGGHLTKRTNTGRSLASDSRTPKGDKSSRLLFGAAIGPDAQLNQFVFRSVYIRDNPLSFVSANADGSSRLHAEQWIDWTVLPTPLFTFNKSVLKPHIPDEMIDKIVYVLSAHQTPQLLSAYHKASMGLVASEGDNETFLLKSAEGKGNVSLSSTRFNSLLLANKNGSVTLKDQGECTASELKATVFTCLHDAGAGLWILRSIYGQRLCIDVEGKISLSSHPLNRWANWSIQICTRDTKAEVDCLMNRETRLLHGLMRQKKPSDFHNDTEFPGLGEEEEEEMFTPLQSTWRMSPIAARATTPAFDQTGGGSPTRAGDPVSPILNGSMNTSMGRALTPMQVQRLQEVDDSDADRPVFGHWTLRHSEAMKSRLGKRLMAKQQKVQKVAHEKSALEESEKELEQLKARYVRQMHPGGEGKGSRPSSSQAQAAPGPMPEAAAAAARRPSLPPLDASPPGSAAGSRPSSSLAPLPPVGEI